MDGQQSRGKRINQGTFIVNIKFRENATWQGEVVWVDKKQKKCFRSALELMKLMDSALDEGSEEIEEKIENR